MSTRGKPTAIWRAWADDRHKVYVREILAWETDKQVRFTDGGLRRAIPRDGDLARHGYAHTRREALTRLRTKLQAEEAETGARLREIGRALNAVAVHLERDLLEAEEEDDPGDEPAFVHGTEAIAPRW